MHSLQEYDSFVRKFVNLWRSGVSARLCVETEAGNAFVSLHLDLGQACPPQVQPEAGHHHGGGPARKRRREKRADARQEAAMAEKANVAAENDASEKSKDAEKAESESELEFECSNGTTSVTENKVIETKECLIAKEVTDEICDDEHYVDNISAVNIKCDDSKNAELSVVKQKEGFVRKEAGEIVVEIRPQYCKFDEDELADKLGKQMGLELLCLPWIANTGPHFYTAGCKISEESYERFKAKGGGSLPKGFYTVETSRKIN